MKHLTILCLLTMLTTLLCLLNTSTTAQTTSQLPYQIFTIQPYSYNSSIIKTGEIEYLSLPSDSLPMGILYDSTKNKVWIALYLNSSIASIDVLSKDITIYPLPYHIDENFSGPMPWTLAIDPNNCIWFSIRSYKVTPRQPPSYIPYLGKLDLTSNTIYIYYIPKGIGGGSDIRFYKNYIWYMTVRGLSRINYTTGELVESYLRDFSDGFMVSDGDCLWLSSVGYNFVTRFNITSESFDINLTGFDRPSGMFVDTTKVYVAENSNSKGKLESIAVIDKATLNVSRIYTGVIITNEGTYHVYKSAFGNLWWSDNSGHVGCILLNGTKLIYNAPRYCYFMTEVPGNSIWFSAVGSAYIGITKDSKPSSGNIGSSSGVAIGRKLLW